MKISKEHFKYSLGLLIIFTAVGVTLLSGGYTSAMSASADKEAPIDAPADASVDTPDDVLFDVSIDPQVDAPEIVYKDGRQKILLPKPLIEHIKTNFTGLRFPMQSDITGYWSEWRFPGSFPFIKWGDFNGSGRIDVALILIAEKEWKFVIFERLEKGYQSAYTQGGEINDPSRKIQRPQQVVLRLIKKGEGWAPEYGDIPRSYEHEFDAVDFSIYGSSPSGFDYVKVKLIYWVDGEYRRYQ